MRKKPYYLFSLTVVVAVAGLAALSPIPQDPAYHNFADKRLLLGIPNFWDVVSNVPMFFIGAFGLWQCFKRWSQWPEGIFRWIFLVLSLGIFSTSFGSAYYHWAPDNHTLVWDRLPMTLMFMSLFALLLHDYLGKNVGKAAFIVAVPVGICSVFYWHFTELAGHGDLRPYAFVQFFPMLAALLLMLLYPGKVPYVRYVLLVLGWYTLAKLCEHNDRDVFGFTGFWSGHTLKHLLGAVGLIYVLKITSASAAASSGEQA